MNILILGKNSFIGNAYATHSHYPNIQKISLKEISPDEIPYSQYDVIIYLAAIVHQKKEISKKKCFEVNTELPFQIAKNAQKANIKHFIYLSSASVYGKTNPSQTTLNESSSCNPVNYYGKSKLAAEEQLLSLNSEYFKISIIRPPLVFGPGVKANMLSLIKLVDKLPILPFKSSKEKRSFISTFLLTKYIDQIISTNKSGVFIATDPFPMATSEVVKLISLGLSKKVILFEPPKFIKTILSKFKPGLMEKLYGSFILDNQKTLKMLNFEPESDLETEIINMALHYKLNKKVIN